MKKTKELSYSMGLNHVLNSEAEEKLGIITSGISHAYCLDVLRSFDIEVPILKLGMTNPLSDKLVAEFLGGLKSVIVLEELDPFLEEAVARIAAHHNMDIRIYGKGTDHFPSLGEYNPDIVKEGIRRVISEYFPDIVPKDNTRELPQISPLSLPSRPPVLCPGCPHRATAYAAKKAASGNAVFPMDIGCYTLVVQDPLGTADIVLCMGSSVGTACGFSHVTDQEVLAFIGDSTFFHAGIPGLINAVHHDHKFVLTVLDNRTTAMTGFQPHPGVLQDSASGGKKSVDIRDIASACGVEYVKVVDPYDYEETLHNYQEALIQDTMSVIISRHACALVELREKRKQGQSITPYRVDSSTCIKCHTCASGFGCPAIIIGDDDYPVIDLHLCVGCSVCAQLCPTESIHVHDGRREEGQ
jgi:indolepyruvate ferredoxin oxidoreductase alpha subunit